MMKTKNIIAIVKNVKFCQMTVKMMIESKIYLPSIHWDDKLVILLPDVV